MTKKEELEQLAYNENIPVDYIDFTGDRIRGLYVNGSIALQKGMSDSETADILAEELGHHYTSVGNILNMNEVKNRKQERIARLWAYQSRIGLAGIVMAYKEHCQNRYEMAEFLGVSEQFLKEALESYQQIYGAGVLCGKYYIRFEPYLQVYEYVNFK